MVKDTRWSRTTKRMLHREWSRARETLPGKCDLKFDRKCSTRSMRRRFALVFFVRCFPAFSCFPAMGHFWVTKTLSFKTRLNAKAFLCNWIFFAWEYHWKSSYKKSFKFIMPMVFLLVANLLKHFKRGRGVCMYTTQVNSAFRGRWLASSVISQVLFLAFKWRHKNPYSKIARTFRVYLHLAKDLLKLNFCASFQSDNFASLLCVTLILRPKRPSLC